jgi:hypothetical protein
VKESINIQQSTLPGPGESMNKFELVVETVAKDVVAGVEKVVGIGEDVFRVLTSANQLAPAFKTELAQLITDGEPIVAALTPAIAAGGENVALDLAAIAPVCGSLRRIPSHTEAGARRS